MRPFSVIEVSRVITTARDQGQARHAAPGGVGARQCYSAVPVMHGSTRGRHGAAGPTGPAGPCTLPGDKSISHRYAILGALAEGETTLTRFAPGRRLRLDAVAASASSASPCRATAATVRLAGRGLRGLTRADGPARLRQLRHDACACSPASWPRMPFETTLTGDASLRRRPMRRVAVPLERMGAALVASRWVPTAHHHRGPPPGNRLRSRNPQRPGQECGAAGGTPGRGSDNA